MDSHFSSLNLLDSMVFSGSATTYSVFPSSTTLDAASLQKVWKKALASAPVTIQGSFYRNLTNALFQAVAEMMVVRLDFLCGF
jgi:hypothetical protein